MTEVLSPPEPVRGRRFVKGRSGNPTGRRYGSRNKKTLTAAVLLDGEAEALTRKAVELALAGDPTALRLCIESILPPRTSGEVYAAADRELRGYLCRDECGHRRTRPRHHHPGRGREDRQCGRHPRAGDHYNQKERVRCRSTADFGIEQFL